MRRFWGFLVQLILLMALIYVLFRFVQAVRGRLF